MARLFTTRGAAITFISGAPAGIHLVLATRRVASARAHDMFGAERVVMPQCLRTPMDGEMEERPRVSNRRRAGTATIAGLAVVASALVAPLPANAAEVEGVAGGWVEGEETSSGSDAQSTRAGAGHRGTAETKVVGGTTNKRAHGWTTWPGVKHYTTAQLEHYWPASGVIATSGRRWGTGGTEAVSPWRAYNPNAASNGYGQARTYYGR